MSGGFEPCRIVLGVEQFVQIADDLIIRADRNLLSKEDDRVGLPHLLHGGEAGDDGEGTGAGRSDLPMAAQPRDDPRFLLFRLPDGPKDVTREKRRNLRLFGLPEQLPEVVARFVVFFGVHGWTDKRVRFTKVARICEVANFLGFSL